MRPVNQSPLSLNEMKRSPLRSSRSPDNPPKPGKGEVSTRPLRYCSEPNRRCERSRMSNDGIGRAVTLIATGALTETAPGASGFAGGSIADCACASPAIAADERPAAAEVRKRRRERRGRKRHDPKRLDPKRFGPKKIGPGRLGPKRLGPKRFGPKRFGRTGEEDQECRRRPERAGATPWVSLNSSASFSVMAPPS